MKRLVMFLALVVLLTACGLPSDGEPRQIADDKVPFELLGPSTTTPNSNVTGGPSVHLYFLDGTQLRSVNRSVPTRDTKTVLDELVKGIIESDPFGITTAIPKDTQIVSVANDGDTVVVTLSNAILNIGGAEQKNAFGQMVYTATDLDSRAIRFRVTDASGGNVQDVPTPTDNGAKAEPLTRSDFISLRPRG
jgi:spore germination protein GerM